MLYLVTLAVTVLATIVLVYAVQARVRLPELHAWHRVVLREEAGRDHPAAFESFDAYRQQEERLFAELRERIYAGPEADTFTLGRYNPRSVVAKLALDTPYNRTYELVPAGEPRGSVLLMHGLSDSPYSMRGIAEVFQSRGYYVVALRLPGHGTRALGAARRAVGRLVRGCRRRRETRGRARRKRQALLHRRTLDRRRAGVALFGALARRPRAAEAARALSRLRRRSASRRSRC